MADIPAHPAAASATPRETIPSDVTGVSRLRLRFSAMLAPALVGAVDLPFLPIGEVYLAAGYLNSRVMTFDAAGHFLLEWVEFGSRLDTFCLPHASAVDRAGALYLAETCPLTARRFITRL